MAENLADNITDNIADNGKTTEVQTENKMTRMRELVDILNRARRAYEQEDTEVMSNYEYDRLYDELLELEKELNTTLAASPTVNVGYEVLSELPKERHERPMPYFEPFERMERKWQISVSDSWVFSKYAESIALISPS